MKSLALQFVVVEILDVMMLKTLTHFLILKDTKFCRMFVLIHFLMGMNGKINGNSHARTFNDNNFGMD